MIEYRRAVRRILICLIAALGIVIAAAPILQTESGTVWAASKKAAKKKSSKKKKKNARKNGFVRKNGSWYYYEEGKKKTGWITVGTRRYYAVRTGSRRGRLVEGWFTIKKKQYYFREEGKKGVICSLAAGGTCKVNGIKCIFDEEGQFVKCKHAGSTDGFINEIGEKARINQVYNNILASLVVAQACLETGYGSNVYHNNLFGIRAGSGYRRYDSYDESIEDYVEFMHTYIPRIFGVRDSGTACSIIGRSGYAEAGGYGSILMSIVSSNDLTRFDK